MSNPQTRSETLRAQVQRRAASAKIAWRKLIRKDLLGLPPIKTLPGDK